jgi:hypothetical protein
MKPASHGGLKRKLIPARSSHKTALDEYGRDKYCAAAKAQLIKEQG